jgi:hypothetical protein
LRALLRYWLHLRGDHDVPRRADLDPVLQAPRLVANLALLRMDPPAPFFRVIGSDIVRWAKRDLTGRVISDETFPGEAARMCKQLGFVARERRPLGFTVGYGPLRTIARCVIGLPFAEPDGRVRDILVGVFFDGREGDIFTELPAPQTAEIDVVALIAELKAESARE